MSRFKKTFTKTTIIVVSVYFALLILWLGCVLIDKHGGFGGLPFGIGEVLGGFYMIMFLIQISAAKIMLQGFPPGLFQFLQAGSSTGLSFGLIIANFINIFLLIVFSFVLSGIYFLAMVGDRKMADKFGNS